MANKYIKDLTTTTTPSLTGHTIFDDGVSTFKTSLQTLRQELVDNGSHNFTGSQIINGDLTISGSIIAQQYILSSSITNMITETISGSSNFGNSNDDNHSFTGSVKVKGSLSLNDVQLNISGSGSHLAYFTGPQSITSSDVFHVDVNNQTLGLGTDAFSNPAERLMVGSGNFNIATFQTATVDNYAQVNIKNFNSGSNASADLVLWNNVGTENSHYVDLGINSSNYTGGYVGRQGDGYLYSQDGGMYVGAMGIGGISGSAHLHLFGAGAWNNPAISIYNNNTVGFFVEKPSEQFYSIPSASYGFRTQFSGSVKMDNNLTVDGTHQMNGFTILTNVTSSFNDDTEAASAGVPLHGLYRSGSHIMIRLT